MAYSNFTLDGVLRAFALDIDQEGDLFAPLPSQTISAALRGQLEENVSLAVDISTEKARSELIVMPVLMEVRKLMRKGIGLFSGVEFNVEPEKGLSGYCDFLLTRSPIQLFVRSPVLTVVEAKNDNVNAGLGQCAAEMVAARIFNERAGDGPTTIHGAVTTGSIWKFLRLEGGTVFVDRPEYYLDQIEKILAILLHCVGGKAPVPTLA